MAVKTNMISKDDLRNKATLQTAQVRDRIATHQKQAKHISSAS